MAAVLSSQDSGHDYFGKGKRVTSPLPKLIICNNIRELNTYCPQCKKYPLTMDCESCFAREIL